MIKLMIAASFFLKTRFRAWNETVTVKVCILLVKKNKQTKKTTTLEMNTNYSPPTGHLGQTFTHLKKKKSGHPRSKADS